MKKFLSIFMVALMVAVLCTSVSAADEYEAHITYVPGEITIDGVKDDLWGDTPTVVTANGYQDINAEITMFWDEQGLYFYIEVNDTTPDMTNANIWERDYIGWFISLDYITGVADLAIGFVNNMQCQFDRNGVKHDYGTYTGLDIVVVDNGTDGWVAEGTLRNENIALTEGSKILMDWCVGDGLDGVRAGESCWTPEGYLSFLYADRMGTIVLDPMAEAPETEAPETEAPETEAPETEAPETEAPQTGFVTAALMVAAVGSGAYVVSKKRKNNHLRSTL